MSYSYFDLMLIGGKQEFPFIVEQRKMDWKGRGINYTKGEN